MSIFCIMRRAACCRTTCRCQWSVQATTSSDWPRCQHFSAALRLLAFGRRMCQAVRMRRRSMSESSWPRSQVTQTMAFHLCTKQAQACRTKPLCTNAARNAKSSTTMCRCRQARTAACQPCSTAVAMRRATSASETERQRQKSCFWVRRRSRMAAQAKASRMLPRQATCSRSQSRQCRTAARSASHTRSACSCAWASRQAAREAAKASERRWAWSWRSCAKKRPQKWKSSCRAKPCIRRKATPTTWRFRRRRTDQRCHRPRHEHLVAKPRWLREPWTTRRISCFSAAHRIQASTAAANHESPCSRALSEMAAFAVFLTRRHRQ
mmetsp:Transcript_11642/g.41548  ORF Transcript_11642/g.41548 Transcript_11642/m.41548 type:complete len:323 (-) Transcript_11642:3365-4333(-)